MTQAKSQRKWSQAVTERSDALDIADDTFKARSATAIARSLKRSAQASARRKSTPFRAAMSMLSFYINRAGTNLSPRRRRMLEAAKDALRKAFGRAPAAKSARRGRGGDAKPRAGTKTLRRG